MMNNWVKIIIGDSKAMIEVEDEFIDLIITSPPYWHIKDYGITGQIGYGQKLHEYLKDLYYVWQESYRILRPGSRLCINIGDQFARAVVYGRYKVIPIHAELIAQCENIGFDFMGSIIWQKKTTMNTTGGATVMGSFPFPPNGIVEIDYEYIHIFKKPGKSKKVSKELKEASKLSKSDWKEFFSGHWQFGGARQLGHEAMFPDELPRRLIRMFTFVGDTVLDPFVGSGTAAKVALELNRNSIGYEINEDFLPGIQKKLGLKESLVRVCEKIQIIRRDKKIGKLPKIDYHPRIQDAKPQLDSEAVMKKRDILYKVTDIINENTIELNSDLNVRFLGVKIRNKAGAMDYLKNYIMRKEVFLKLDDEIKINDKTLEAYVYLKNKIFVNSYLIKSGLATPDTTREFSMKDRFLKL
jgi:DNA modification methylase